MNLVSAHQLKKSYGSRPLFDGISFAVQEKERVGLIGPNGAGKSTLLKILAGTTSQDSGSLSFQRGLRIGFLEQSPFFNEGSTVFSSILEARPRTVEPWEQEALVHELMSKLSLEDGPVQSLSGGWKKRVALARELAKEPDLLLLDEPTNHLDVESILWLEEFLSSARFSFVTVTHDRLFLQRIANRILELDRRNENGLLSVQGDYATYLETKDALMQAQERREIVLKNTLRRETEWLRRGAKARTTKQQARIKRAGELGEEVEELQSRNQARVARLDFQDAENKPKRLLEAVSISKKYGDRVLFKDLNLLLSPGTRVGLLGPNGCGKSTLIRVLLGRELQDTGQIQRADNLQVAYFEQNRETLDPDLTITETLCPRGDFVEYRGSRIHIRSYLDRFLFTKEQMVMKVGNLSGGEQSRLLMASLMLSPANLLVLDEPTNDLDMATLTVLEECLKDFTGAVLLVTHDRYFLDQVATKILSFGGHGGALESFAEIEQWERWHLETKKEEKRSGQPKQVEKEKLSSSSVKRKLSFKEQRELDLMEDTIHTAESKLAALEAESSQPGFNKDIERTRLITKEMADLQAHIESLYARWSELEGKTK